jgi:hypothetical protein
VVNKSRQPITDKSDLYSGVWAYVDVNMYPFNFEGKIGIACGLNNIMKVKDDEALAGGQSAETAFAAVEIGEDDFI